MFKSSPEERGSREINYCSKCLMPNSRPRIKFDDDGICNACRYAEKKHNEINWINRENEFINILDKYRTREATWDCVVPWSGGKDCCLSCYQATVSGMKVRYLLNMIKEDGKQSWSHGLSSKCLEIQSQALGIPMIQHQTSSADYKAEFIKALQAMKREGVEGGVFGDIDFNEHREWIDGVCGEAGVAAHLPLWERSQDEIMREFVDLGFEAVVVAAKADLFGEEWLGRKIDMDFIRDLDDLRKTKEITPCGEAGEYHTFVIDGPLFKQRIEILEANKVLREDRWFLEIKKCDLRSK